MNMTIAEECLILISNAPKCFGGWGTPLGKLTTLPRPLIVRGFAPSALDTHYFTPFCFGPAMLWVCYAMLWVYSKPFVESHNRCYVRLEARLRSTIGYMQCGSAVGLHVVPMGVGLYGFGFHRNRCITLI